MLQALQNLIATIYDVRVRYDVCEFLLTDRSCLPQALEACGVDEQVLVAEDRETFWMSVYLDDAVLKRLASANPLEALHAGNLADYLTALEGVSHFVCLAWHAEHDWPVTMLELELQGEIDKYVTSLWLIQEQQPNRFPIELHHLLFDYARVDALLVGDRIGIYERANCYAARFCRRLSSSLRPTERAAHAEAIAELRRFYRFNRERKFHHIEHTA